MASADFIYCSGVGSQMSVAARAKSGSVYICMGRQQLNTGLGDRDVQKNSSELHLCLSNCTI